MADHVAILGGGFSGAMLAAQLSRAGTRRITLIERGNEPGRGLAYGAADPIHLLNVRAGNMSAWPDEAGHFAHWLEANGAGDAATFASRRLFGHYVQEQLGGAERVERVSAGAVDLQSSPGGVRIHLDDGGTIDADAAVLAVGNLPPPPPPGFDPSRLPNGIWYGDPWVTGVAEGLGPDDAVLVIGTGLTMIDMVLLLEARGFTGPILAVSRRGLTPHAHASEPAPTDKRSAAATTEPSALLREIRARGAQIGWRHAVDELRPFTQAMWRAASPTERRRFLRHLRPWWDVHRHRIAPEIHARVAAMIARGQLRVAAGKLAGAEAEVCRALISWRPRGRAAIETFTASRIINCTGPEGDLPRSTEPLLRSLLARGTIRPGPGGLGIDVDAEMHVLGSDGGADPRLRAVGPLTRGVFWEIVAVPDIRVQVQTVAQSLATA